ncbi:MAG: hypothetical protein AAGI92_05365 [Pseudomonadota bacterium]
MGLGLLGVSTVGACTVQPLYTATDPAAGDFSSTTKGKVNFASADNRIEQVTRDTMIFRLNGGGSSAAINPVFDADISVTSTISGRFRTPDTSAGQTSASVVTVSGTLTLKDSKTGAKEATIKRSSITSIDRGGQDFANERAELDAEKRGAIEIGEQFATLVAARLAQQN